jgi:hypothetical protein
MQVHDTWQLLTRFLDWLEEGAFDFQFLLVDELDVRADDLDTFDK